MKILSEHSFSVLFGDVLLTLPLSWSSFRNYYIWISSYQINWIAYY